MTRVRVVVLLSGAILVSAACSAAPPPSGGSAVPSSAAVPATVGPVPSPSVAIASTEPSSPPPAAPAFTLATPPPAASAWTGIAWRKLAAGDPLSGVRSALRWSGGFVAVGGVIADGTTSRTPVWVSTDGAAWQALPTDTFGPAGVVLGVVETPTALIALTLDGGANTCGDESLPLDCWTLTPPLRSWTSTDGRAWTAHPGPDVTLTPIVEGEPGVDPPIIVGGRAGALVATDGATGAHASVSQDGITWAPSAQVAIPTIWGFYDDTAAFRDGFVAVGRSPDETGHGVAITSSDGSAWDRRSLPTAGFRAGWLGKGVGFRASRLVAGPAGLIAVGGAFVTPGAELWWSSLDGRTWRTMPTYGPLGVWVGPAEGSGITPNGVLAGNGERMVAYRADGKDAAWTSFDGRTWHRLALTGGNLPPPDRDPVLMPGGILWSGNDGSMWLGTPST